MKKYTIKNYKGNIVESLTRFAKTHKGIRIVEAKEEDEELKIKTEAVSGTTKETIEEAVHEYFWDSVIGGDDYSSDDEQRRVLRALENGPDPDDEVVANCLEYLKNEYEINVDKDADEILNLVCEQLEKLASEYLHR